MRHGKITSIGRRRIKRHYIGKPEPLKEDMSGYWSRRIDDVNRLVYRISGDVMEIGEYHAWNALLESQMPSGCFALYFCSK